MRVPAMMAVKLRQFTSARICERNQCVRLTAPTVLVFTPRGDTAPLHNSSTVELAAERKRPSRPFVTSIRS